VCGRTTKTGKQPGTPLQPTKNNAGLFFGLWTVPRSTPGRVRGYGGGLCKQNGTKKSKRPRGGQAKFAHSGTGRPNLAKLGRGTPRGGGTPPPLGGGIFHPGDHFPGGMGINMRGIKKRPGAIPFNWSSGFSSEGFQHPKIPPPEKKKKMWFFKTNKNKIGFFTGAAGNKQW